MRHRGAVWILTIAIAQGASRLPCSEKGLSENPPGVFSKGIA